MKIPDITCVKFRQCNGATRCQDGDCTVSVIITYEYCCKLILLETLETLSK